MFKLSGMIKFSQSFFRICQWTIFEEFIDRRWTRHWFPFVFRIGRCDDTFGSLDVLLFFFVFFFLTFFGNALVRRTHGRWRRRLLSISFFDQTATFFRPMPTPFGWHFLVRRTFVGRRMTGRFHRWIFDENVPVAFRLIIIVVVVVDQIGSTGVIVRRTRVSTENPFESQRTNVSLELTAHRLQSYREFRHRYSIVSRENFSVCWRVVPRVRRQFLRP